MKFEKMNAAKLQQVYNQRLAWALQFREVLPTILRIGEEVGASMLDSYYDIGLAHLKFRFGGRLVGEITKHAPAAADSHVLFFKISPSYGYSVVFNDRVDTPNQLEAVCRQFFTALIRVQSEFEVAETAREARNGR